MPVKFVNFLKSRLIFNICYSFWKFVNKLSHISRAHISKSGRCFDVKSSTYYFHIMADFQICISAPLKFHGSTKKGNIKISQRKYLFDIKDDSREIPCGKIPTNQTPSLKNPPQKSPDSHSLCKVVYLSLYCTFTKIRLLYIAKI